MRAKTTLILMMLALVALPVAAQEEAAAAPAGLGWLFLLLGLGAIITIGFVMFARDQSAPADKDNSPS